MLKMEEYRNPLVTEGEFASPMTKDFKDICEWLISVVNDVEKKLVEFLMQKFKLVIKNITKI
jgi:hypothetical protein